MWTRPRSSRCVLAVLLTLLCRPALGDDDGLDPYRDRFRLGMDRYKAGALGEAIRVWGALYEELGPHRGYRLAFDLGRAHDANGEATRAAERYTSFLDEVTKRRQGGEAIEPLVVHEEEQARDRIRDLNHTHGRIHVMPGPGSELTQIDDSDPRLGAFIAYVAPGAHVVTFSVGRPASEKVEITVGADELVDAHPAPPPPEPPRTAPEVPTAPLVPTVRETTRPFPAVLLFTAAGVSAASIAAPAAAYAHAYSQYDVYRATAQSRAQLQGAYLTARSTAYALLALPIGLGVATTGLTVWYFAKTGKRDVPVSLAAAALPGGGVASVSGSF